MRILVLTRYNPAGPSSRVRFYQYFPYLQSKGVDLQVLPFFGDEYVNHLYAGNGQPVLSIVKSYTGRIAGLVKSHSVDLLWIEKEIFPWLPAFMDSLFLPREIPCIVDYDDAIYHRYDLHGNPLVRSLLGKKIDTIMRKASVVVVGNDVLGERARSAGAVRLEILPSVVDLERYKIREKKGDLFRIGWIGSPVTAPYLELVRDALQEVTKRSGVNLVLVGCGNRDPLPGLAKEILSWSEAGEVANIQSFDAGIMPLPDGPFERGKCGYKLVQYMACGLPVIASPVGVNTRIVQEGVNGFLASNHEQWLQALVLLSQNPRMREEFGKAGRKKVEQEFSLQVTAPRMLNILAEAIARKVTHRKLV
jgi:glycosyltransferase involved in cell wall biosynthesis